ncbi:hypothetical protein [Endozoicomonas sp.]|uniref:DUF2541 family protein n=1 Tax=Endozoicomonas sp. TaxID=1892382 RepID=UPI0028870576|nr:hypothetical protein [Endozoicomonas sp.]
MKKLLTLVLMSVLSCSAMAGDWKKLGERRVSFSSEQEVIHVSGFKGKYDTIAFKIDKAPIFMKKIKVTFGNGKSQNIFINKRLNKGKRSMPFRLLEGDRVINKVEMDYRTAIGGQKYAKVTLYGKRS